MKKELSIFLTAIVFFTRIPCARHINYTPDLHVKSSRYFSLVGIIIGLFGSLIYYVSEFFFNDAISILLSMLSTIWLTGAFHEDGFADVCDGFGGGWTKEKIMAIMKDSRVGTYGVVGLIILLTLKHQSLVELNLSTCFLALISGHAVSRFSATFLMYKANYVQDLEKSKTKAILPKISLKNLITCGLISCVPLFLFFNPYVFLIWIPVLITTYLLIKYFEKWIGGYTGDCAGATQQITEVVFYLTLLIVL